MPDTCQVCGGTNLLDYVKHEEGHYLRCASCGLVLNADAQALVAAAADHYDDPAYFEGYERRFAKKLRAAHRRLDIVSSYAPAGRLLDVGCGMGDTLVAAREAGYEAEGLDIGGYPLQRCAALGFTVHQASVTDTGLPGDHYDVVTLWDVIEHIPRSAEGLCEVHRILKPGGVAAILAPSSAYLKAHLLRRTYQNYRGLWARTHFVYHTPATLARVLRQCGLQPLPLPVLRRSALHRGLMAGAAEVLVALPRYAAWQLRAACRLTRNIFILARKGPAPA